MTAKVLTVAFVSFGFFWTAVGVGSAQSPQPNFTVSHPTGFAVSPAHSQAAPAAQPAASQTPTPLRSRPSAPGGPSADLPDPALQTSPGAPLDEDGKARRHFPGVGAAGVAPGDPNMAVGPNHIVQIVNTQYAVYDKSGNIFPNYPQTLGSIFAALRNSCSGEWGDPIAQYDKAADRWLLSQVGSLSPPFLECIAVSQTNDPTGPYNLYSYSFGSNLNDYQKIGVWPTATNSAYLATYNLFLNGSNGIGADLCAYDRAAMLSGAASPVQICFEIANDFSYLPSDLDGSTVPPASAPGIFLTLETVTTVRYYLLSPNFANPGSSTLSPPTDIPVAAFGQACGGGVCIPQPGTSQQLDSLGDRPMYRLAYRNFGDHEALVVNHSVTAGSSVGVRWYELRSPLTETFTLFQQGTFAPDATYRWMGSAAMDSSGDIAIGYSASSSSVFPGLRYTGRAPTDALGTMRAESIMFNGIGSQTGGLSRWGDYSALRIDPGDDCTFWYTNQYLPSNGSFNWATVIGSFHISTCSATPDFAISVSPLSQTVNQGSKTSYTATVTGLNGFSGTVNLGVSGLPNGATALFVPASITGSGGSTLTVTTGASTPTGTYTLTITGASGLLSHTSSTGLTVTLPLVSIAVTPANPSLTKGLLQAFTATGTYSDNSTQNLTSTVTWSSSNTAAATITAAGVATAAGVGSATITAAMGAVSGSTVLTVTAPQLVSLAVTPANGSLLMNSTQAYTATGTYTDSSMQNLTGSVTWSSGNSTVATITAAGVAAGVAAGATTIQATLGVISGSTNVTVVATLPGLVGYWTFDDGSGTTAADSSGGGHNAALFNGIPWVAGKIGSAVSANGTNQYASIPAIDLSGTNAATITLWVNRTYSTTGTHILVEATTNYNGSTTGFMLLPDDPTCGGIQVAVHGNGGYSVNCYTQPTSGVWHHLAAVFDKSQQATKETALYIDGVLQTPTQNLNTSTNTNSFGNNPIYLFSRAGSEFFAGGTVDEFRIYNRALAGTEIQQIFNYAAARLVSIAVTPANPSLAKGLTQAFTATGTYSDNSTQNLTSSVTWSSSNTAAATITAAGMATAAGVGNATITAALGAVSGSTLLTVTAAQLVSLAVTPANVTIVKAGTQAYTATGTYTDNTTQNLTGSVTWSSSNTSVATITAAGMATAAGVGNATITAALGAVSGSTGVTVTLPLVSIAVTPANPSLAKGLTQAFTATGTYTDSSTQNLTSSVTWSSSNAAVATIAAGVATAAGVGNATITAALGAVSGSTVLTVTAPQLVSLAVTPANGSLLMNSTLAYTATGTYTDASTQNLTSSVTWSSGNTAVATITAAGVATGVGAGATTIQATLGVINGSTNVTVAASLPGLVGYWTFDDGTGTTAADSSGGGHNAALFNGVSWVAGKIGSAVSANGTNQYASIPAINLSGTNAVTITLWVNRTYSTTGTHILVEATTNYNSSTTGFMLLPDDSTCGGIQVAVHGNGGYSVNCYTQPSSGVWHHLAAVFDKSQPATKETSLYIDGVLQTPKRNLNTSTNTNNFGNNPIYLFSRAGSQFFAGGTVDDFRIYSRALAASEIQQIYAFQ